MAEGDKKEKSERMAEIKLSLNELENYSASSVASEALADREARAEFSASRTAIETQQTAEPEVPAVHVLSHTIIQRLGTKQ